MFRNSKNQMNQLNKANHKNKKKDLFLSNKNYSLDLIAKILQELNGELHNLKIFKISNKCLYILGTLMERMQQYKNRNFKSS